MVSVTAKPHGGKAVPESDAFQGRSHGMGSDDETTSPSRRPDAQTPTAIFESIYSSRNFFSRKETRHEPIIRCAPGNFSIPLRTRDDTKRLPRPERRKERK